MYPQVVFYEGSYSEYAADLRRRNGGKDPTRVKYRCRGRVTLAVQKVLNFVLGLPWIMLQATASSPGTCLSPNGLVYVQEDGHGLNKNREPADVVVMQKMKTWCAAAESCNAKRGNWHLDCIFTKAI